MTVFVDVLARFPWPHCVPASGGSSGRWPRPSGVLPFGVAAVDRALPGGGLARGAVHEILGQGGDEEDGAAAAGFAAGILARLGDGDAVLWCLRRPDLYGPGLAAHGLDPARLVLVPRRATTDILWALEEGLRARRGLAAVVGEVGRLPMVASRRLQLAAERSGVTALLLRRWRTGGEAARRARPAERGDDALAGHLAPVGRAPCERESNRGSGARAGGSSCCAAAAASRRSGRWRWRMRRVMYLFLPNWPIDRLRRLGLSDSPSGSAG